MQRAHQLGEVLAEVTALFLEGYAELIDGLTTAVGTGDLDTTVKIAHRLKGELGTLGATRAFEAGQEVGTLARAADVHGVQRAFDWFLREMELVEPELVALARGV